MGSSNDRLDQVVPGRAVASSAQDYGDFDARMAQSAGRNAVAGQDFDARMAQSVGHDRAAGSSNDRLELEDQVVRVGDDPSNWEARVTYGDFDARMAQSVGHD